MEDSTYAQAVNLKKSLVYLNVIKNELATAETQRVIQLQGRSDIPASPPSALTDSLGAIQSFLLAQAVTQVDTAIDTFQDDFDNLVDP